MSLKTKSTNKRALRMPGTVEVLYSMALYGTLLVFVLNFVFIVRLSGVLGSENENIIEKNPIVEILNGKIEGTHHGNFLSFESIPYAEPPINENRFKPPKEWTHKWEGTLDATKPPAKCMQWSGIPTESGDFLIGDEDCLTVNVFTPIISRNDNQLLPVMVFIHGGGFMWGSEDFYGPNYLMNEGGLVLVKFNYRLGPLGFLSTEDNEISGNMGLKDQVMALKWVKQNIRFFNGDPEKITLTGFSAGGASVQMHLFSEMSQGLANTAISFSGSALAPCCILPNPLEKAKKVAKLLNCPDICQNDTHQLKECLLTKPAEDIVRTVPHFQKIFYNPFIIFSPTIEKPSETEQRFFTNSIETLMQNQKCSKIPWLNSHTSEDGGYSAAEFLQKDSEGKEYINLLNNKWNELVPIILFYGENRTQSDQDKISNDLRAKYFGDKQISIETYSALEKMYTDIIFKDGIRKSLDLLDSESKNIYGYLYDNPSVFGFGQILSNRTDYHFGTVHGDDVLLIFNSNTRDNYPLTPNEVQMSKDLISMITEFATTGVPKFRNTTLTPVKTLQDFYVIKN